LISALVIAHSLAFAWLDRTFGLSGRGFCMTYVLVASLYWGIRGGIVSALLTIPLNILLARFAGLEVLPAGWWGALGILVGGGILGRMGELNMRLREELHERSQAEGELKQYQKHLKNLVKLRTGDLSMTSTWLHQEIGERKRIEAALRDSEKRFRELADFLPQTVFEMDVEGKITFANRNALVTFGYTQSDLERGLHATEMIHREDREFAAKQIMKVLRGESSSGREFRALRKDGSTFPVIIYSNPIMQEDSPVGLRGIMVDITEYKRLESDLFRSQKMESVGRLAGGVAHDLNNFLTTIVGYSELGMTKLEPAQPLYRDLEEILRASDRAAKLTRQLLAFSRRQITEPEVINLNDILVDMDKMLRHLVGEDIELVTLMAEKLRLVKVDPGQIEQVMANLAINARDAMPKGGKLTLETANVRLEGKSVSSNVVVAPGDYVKLAVTDTGTGIAEEDKEHIFEPFYTTKKEGKGTGLGLATCYGIVKQNGGYIWVDSTLDEGTTFRIYLPCAEELPRTSPKLDSRDRLGRGKETILLVEDEPSVRTIAARLLREQGYKILEAANGKDALKVATSHESGQIHLLITDIVMPELGGRELADQLLKDFPDMKVLFMSGYPGEAIARQGGLSSGLILLQKPFSPAQLAQEVRRCLDSVSEPEARVQPD
jgi:PAS domain S-box-containing protein